MTFKLRNIVAATSAVLALGFAGAASADSTDDILNALISKGILTEQEGALILERRANEKQATAEKESKQPIIQAGKKGLVVKSADNSASVAIGGRLHVEAMGHTNDEGLSNGGATDGTDIRRARMYLKGKVSNDWKYIIEADLAGNKVSMKDVFGVYTGVKDWEFTFGNQKHAMSMEVQESSNDIMFTERGFTYALTTPYFDRAIGLNAKVKGDTWNVQAGIYGDQFSAESDRDVEEGHAFAIRGTWNPVWDKKAGKMVHLGANYGFRSMDTQNTINGKNAFAYETTNGSNLKLLNTGNITNLEDVQVSVLEFAAMNGPFSFQSEYTMANLSREGGADVDLTAWYANVGYTLTGETRSYKPTDGEFKRLKPKHDFNLKNGTWGAWEIAARYDELDLNDSDINGGDGSRYTVALNWYLNYNFRIMADYSRIYDIDNGPVTHADGSQADDIDTFTLRGQWAF